MPVNLIAAVGRNGEVGRDGVLPWNHPADLAWFRKMTLGATIVAGPRTFHGLPDLPGREVFCFYRHLDPKVFLGDLVHAFGLPIWIAGGAHTWRVFAPFVDGLKLISAIDYEADDPARHVYFPFDAYGMDWRAR